MLYKNELAQNKIWYYVSSIKMVILFKYDIMFYFKQKILRAIYSINVYLC